MLEVILAPDTISMYTNTGLWHIESGTPWTLMEKLIIILVAVGCIVFIILQMRMKKENKSMEQLRERMVNYQIRSRGINNEKILEAMLSVERHKFVPDVHLSAAYDDSPLPIGHGQTISQPYIVALMTELCEIDSEKRVLEIGTGSGYQAAVLSLLVKHVYSIELVEALGNAADVRLKDLGYNNITVRIDDGYRGWPEEAPFDVIILTAAPQLVPSALVDQLAEGGILIAPIGVDTQELIKMTKNNNAIHEEIITYVRFVPMVHKEK